jgi:hypothetical protein
MLVDEVAVFGTGCCLSILQLLHLLLTPPSSFSSIQYTLLASTDPIDNEAAISDNEEQAPSNSPRPLRQRKHTRATELSHDGEDEYSGGFNGEREMRAADEVRMDLAGSVWGVVTVGVGVRCVWYALKMWKAMERFCVPIFDQPER